MRLLVLATKEWSELTDYEDLENVVDHLFSTLEHAGPIQVYVPAERRRLVDILESRGHFPVVFSEGESPVEVYDRAFFLARSPSSPEMQAAMDMAFSQIARAWLVVHVPPGSAKALVQVGTQVTQEPDPEWAKPATSWDLEVTQVDPEDWMKGL